MNIKTVVFLFSSQMSSEKQRAHKRQIGAIRDTFKRWFPHMNFQIINFQSPQAQIDRYLAASDQIFYVCDHARELDVLKSLDTQEAQESSKLFKLVRIGQHSYHNTLSRLYLVPKYNSKCVSILLNHSNDKTVRSILYAMLLSKSNDFYLDQTFNYEFYQAKNGAKLPLNRQQELFLRSWLRQLAFKLRKFHFNASLNAFLAMAKREMGPRKDFPENKVDTESEAVTAEEFSAMLQYEGLPREELLFVA